MELAWPTNQLIMRGRYLPSATMRGPVAQAQYTKSEVPELQGSSGGGIHPVYAAPHIRFPLPVRLLSLLRSSSPPAS